MRHWFFILCIFLCGFIFPQVVERPSPQRLYNNLSKEFPQFISDVQAAQLEEKLEQFSNETSNQICVLVIDDLNGMDAAQYSTDVMNTWGIGQKDKNNGILILIQPTGGEGQRDLFINVGYGLEGAIPDLATKRIREENMYPYFKTGDFYTGLDQATGVLMQLAKGEINVKDYTRQSKRPDLVRWTQEHPMALVIIVLIIVFIIKAISGGGKGGGGYTYWGGGYSGGSWGGGSSWGGSSGGGWGGFGGGSSGGGGSGGKW